MDIGEKIKQLRIKMNLTQEELANRCELSKGFISQVERNLTSPSIATLMDILEALGGNLKSFFSDSDNNEIVFRKDDVFVQQDDNLGHIINWVIPNAQKNKMEPILIKLRKNGRSQVHTAYEGEVFGYVLRGFVHLHLGEKKFKLKKGESFYHLANAAYFLENAADYDAEVLWVTTPPNF
ncbi:MAG: XRE family transcriptional regulator [Clostridiales bacterium]|nr:XRE family transcriptional regulator [Clostridiales bacterium]